MYILCVYKNRVKPAYVTTILFQMGKWEDTKKWCYNFIWHNHICPRVTTKGYKNDRFTCRDHMYTFTAYLPILSHTQYNLSSDHLTVDSCISNNSSVVYKIFLFLSLVGDSSINIKYTCTCRYMYIYILCTCTCIYKNRVKPVSATTNI